MSFIQSFIPSLAFAIPVHFAHAIKPGIGPDSPQLHFLSSSHSLLPPHLCEPVKLITIYIVYRLVLRFALYLSLSISLSFSFFAAKLIPCSLIAFLNISHAPMHGPRGAEVTPHTLASAR